MNSATWNSFGKKFLRCALFLIMCICGRAGMCTGVQVPEDARGIRSAWNWSYRRWELGLDGLKAFVRRVRAINC